MVLFCQTDVSRADRERPGGRDPGQEHPPLRVGLEAGAAPRRRLRR